MINTDGIEKGPRRALWERRISWKLNKELSKWVEEGNDIWKRGGIKVQCLNVVGMKDKEGLANLEKLLEVCGTDVIRVKRHVNKHLYLFYSSMIQF